MLKRVKTLANAPIVEALAQINYESGRPVGDTELQTYLKPFSGYRSEELNQVQVAPPSPPTVQRYGYRLANETASELIQITRDFFALSRTAKYKNWPDFRTQLQLGFAKFLAEANVTNVNRLALRYTNRFQIPREIGSIKDFLNIYPEMGDLSQNKPETLILQSTMPISAIDGRANVIVRLDRTADDNSIVVLDIDVFMTGKFKPAVEDLLVGFDKLRAIKNDIFLKSLKDDAIKTFDK